MNTNIILIFPFFFVFIFFGHKKYHLIFIRLSDGERENTLVVFFLMVVINLERAEQKKEMLDMNKIVFLSIYDTIRKETSAVHKIDQFPRINTTIDML